MHSYIPLGSSGLKVSRLWLGTMMFGDQTGQGPANEMLALARDAGVNAIDTADNYAGGDSELMVGKLLEGDRDRWVLATKLANPVGSLPNDRGLSRRWIHRAVDASLERLRTDWIDVYYMHRDDVTTPLEETLSTFARLIDDGKIRYYGISNFRAWRIAQVVEAARRMGIPQPIVCQTPYNLLTRGAESELLPCCSNYGVAVVAYSPLARGVLTGKYARNAEPSLDSRAGRGNKRILETDFRDESLAVAEAVTHRARDQGMNCAQFSLAWLRANSLLCGVVGGPRTVDQWKDYLSAIDLQTAHSDETFVDELVLPGHAAAYGFNDPLFPVLGRISG
ncbi:aldo/keto reductase [Paraburkholderia fynbosensis]|uniref:1-deoxyxylulose-5-phosphate synthase YajO n=1 Tax=Paraburkholderia fynbosensis TaxID=1200993 RepID=A0A6J5H0P3_9BURK|nr:aldo/keto reductase [Paraburkholderia fynbosensis]CAB3806948.1 1-deoxyxylulose-5-phosphate synthase YajO [Paraburkholderia fynbosensis]